ncbi:MAG: hemerythrin domain-containing protein [Thermostichales cyanobacterium SZTDM-1c_bins_54]
MSKLIYLCEQQHRQILNLARQVVEAYRSGAALPDKVHIVKQLRQRLSRHIQLERHALFPLMRRYTAGDEWVGRRVKQLEQAVQQLIPMATLFLHEAEQHPERGHLPAAENFFQDLRHQFIQEEKNLHLLYLRLVPPQDEAVQLENFKQRLLATVAANTGSHRIMASGSYPIINQNSGSYRILYGEDNPAPAPELPKHLPMTLEVDRHAETHPLRPPRRLASLG